MIYLPRRVGTLRRSAFGARHEHWKWSEYFYWEQWRAETRRDGEELRRKIQERYA